MVTDKLRELLDLAKKTKLAEDQCIQLLASINLKLSKLVEEDDKPLKGMMLVMHGMISRHTKLTKVGNYYIGLCPFHEEETPSFCFSPKQRKFHCFGCGVDGDFLAFSNMIEEFEG